MKKREKQNRSGNFRQSRIIILDIEPSLERKERDFRTDCTFSYKCQKRPIHFQCLRSAFVQETFLNDDKNA